MRKGKIGKNIWREESEKTEYGQSAVQK